MKRKIISTVLFQVILWAECANCWRTMNDQTRELLVALDTWIIV